jgi:hypothetical protein
MCGFAVVMSAIVDMFKGALAETQHEPAVHGLMEKMLWLTLLVWALFPLVWTLAWLGYVSLGTEQVQSSWGACLGVGVCVWGGGNAVHRALSAVRSQHHMRCITGPFVGQRGPTHH